jgi:hypothetical protein
MGTMWPPEDADQLIAQWNDLGCPRIRLDGGLIITNLERWFYPVGKPKEPYDVLASIRQFLQTSRDELDWLIDL